MTNTDGAAPEAAVVAAQAVLQQVLLDRPELVGDAAQFVSGSISLSAPAPPGGVEVQLSSDRPDVVGVPASVTIPAGEVSAVFNAALNQVKDQVLAIVAAKHGDVSRWVPVLVTPVGGSNGTAVSVAAPAASVTVATVEAASGAPKPEAVGGARAKSTGDDFAELARTASQALDPAWCPETKQSFRAALLAIVPLVPFLAVIAMVAIYAAPSGTALSLFDPLLAGTLFALVVGLLVTLLRWRVIQDTSAERANAASYDEIRERLSAITASLALVAARIDDNEGRQMALREVQASRAQVIAELGESGPAWVLGTAYVNVWKLIHRAEEALIDLEPTSHIIAGALYDEQRLAGSQIDERDQLLTRLRMAVARLDPSSLGYLNQQPVPPVAGSAGSDVTTAETARSVLREVRRTINEFRDQSWSGLVRARDHLMQTLTLTGLVTYFGLLVALDLTGGKPAGYEARADAIIAATVFYLVGALVGLFNRLSSESSDGNDMEDYGLTSARMMLTPVLSGLAAIGGVYLTAMITGTLVGVVGSTSATPPTSLPSASAVLNLTANPFGIVLAGVFGLSPTMLISALQAQAEKYKGALQSTAAHS